MAKPLAASTQMMKIYLAELLTEESAPTDSEPQILEKTAADKKLEQLLQKVTASVDAEEVKPTITSVKSQAQYEHTTPETVTTQKVVEPTITEKVTNKTPTIEVEKVTPQVTETVATTNSLATQESPAQPVKNKHRYEEKGFQAMYFEIAGLIVAVPLIELGGIHNIDKITPLLGKPEWFNGVMIHRDEKINVVDTALWVMPEKCDQKLRDSLNYQYVIMLNNSEWGLMAENLVDTVTLYPDEVKWLENNAKRPWLAGLVKNKMCALLDVEALIQLLSEGANVNQAN